MDLMEVVPMSAALEAPGGTSPPAPSWRRRFARKALFLAALAVPFVLLDFVAIPFKAFIDDLPLQRDLFEPLRDFGGLVLPAMVLGFMAVLDPARRRRVLLCFAAIAVAGLSAQMMKVGVGRERPGKDVFPLHFTGPGGGIFNDKYGSFPSGHTASAFAIAAVLAATYPRARLGFLAIAAGCGLARVAQGRHFPSDAYVGALVGIGSAMLLLHHEEAIWRCITERRWKRRATGS